jgi:hypothetical protein
MIVRSHHVDLLYNGIPCTVHTEYLEHYYAWIGY